MTFYEEMQEILGRVYSPSQAAWIANEIADLVKSGSRTGENNADLFSEKDAVLITYGDSIKTGKDLFRQTATA